MLGHRLAQGVIEGKHLHIVGDALGKNRQLAHEDSSGGGKIVLALLDQIAPHDIVSEDGGQALHAYQRDDQEEGEALAEAHG